MTLVPDHRVFLEDNEGSSGLVCSGRVHGATRPTVAYRIGKRAFDLLVTTVLLLPATLLVALVLLIVNPILNPGPLLYRQTRMGFACKPFRAVKFRTMTAAPRSNRGPHDPIESDRITPLGRFLRRSHFDELPQILNVYRGEMSLIGPRPDTFRHARHFLRVIPHYDDRHTVLPGITGLAQVRLGYAEGLHQTMLKTRSDIDYISRASFALDTWIAWRTVIAVFSLRGS